MRKIVWGNKWVSEVSSEGIKWKLKKNISEKKCIKLREKKNVRKKMEEKSFAFNKQVGEKKRMSLWEKSKSNEEKVCQEKANSRAENSGKKRKVMKQQEN